MRKVEELVSLSGRWEHEEEEKTEEEFQSQLLLNNCHQLTPKLGNMAKLLFCMSCLFPLTL